MTTEGEGLDGVFEDLEQQAEALELTERAWEVAERAAAEYRDVALAERLQASLGTGLRVEVTGAGPLVGTLARVGADCLVLDEEGGRPWRWLVALAHVVEVAGARPDAVARDAWPLTARLGWGAALRRLAEEEQPCVLVRTDGRSQPTRLVRVGADFVEHLPDAGAGAVVLTPFAMLSAVRS